MDKAESRQLLLAAQNGERHALERLISENSGLVHSVVKRFTGRGMEYEDLFQIGNMGMLKAIKNFDMSLDVCFSTYAVHMIIGEIRRSLRDSSSLKVSRGIRETAVSLIKTKEKMERNLNRSISVEELAKESGLSGSEVVFALDALAPAISLNEPLYEDSQKSVELGDTISDDSHENMIEHIALSQAVNKLDPESRAVIALRYYQGRTQSETAKALGISQVQVSRLERKILDKMRLLLTK